MAQPSTSDEKEIPESPDSISHIMEDVLLTQDCVEPHQQQGDDPYGNEGAGQK